MHYLTFPFLELYLSNIGTDGSYFPAYAVQVFPYSHWFCSFSLLSVYSRTDPAFLSKDT